MRRKETSYIRAIPSTGRLQWQTTFSNPRHGSRSQISYGHQGSCCRWRELLQSFRNCSLGLRNRMQGLCHDRCGDRRYFRSALVRDWLPHYSLGLGYEPSWWCHSDLITFRPDSRLLIIEGCLLGGKQCGRTYFVEESGRLRLVAFDPDLLRNGKVAPF